jgi:hypothetical protein
LGMESNAVVDEKVPPIAASAARCVLE